MLVRWLLRSTTDQQNAPLDRVQMDLRHNVIVTHLDYDHPLLVFYRISVKMSTLSFSHLQHHGTKTPV